MKQEVKFQGLSHSPSDYDAQDGELGTCLNLINEDGSLKPVPKPETTETFTLPEGASIELVHKVTHESTIHSHYIVRKADDTWYWTEKGGDGTQHAISLGGFKVNAVTAVGNILCFVGDSKTLYAYWKGAKYTVMDLIDGVDVFVSNSLYPYKTNKDISQQQIKLLDSFEGYGDTFNLELEHNIKEVLYWKSRRLYYVENIMGHWEYPFMTQDELYEEIEKLTFYKSTSFSKEEIKNGTSKYLKRIYQTEETISLASSLSAILGAKVATTYNNRLHLANVNTRHSNAIDGSIVNEADADNAWVITHVKYKYNNQAAETYCNGSQGYPFDPFISFPSDSVSLFEMYIRFKKDDCYYQKYDLHSGGSLGISYYLGYVGGYLSKWQVTSAQKITEEEWTAALDAYHDYEEKYTNSPNVIKVSEAENPLVFPAKNTVQVGSSIVNALAANTRPISEGQFGEAPLYAFTDEGVWMLMVGTEGSYDSRQPANREICSNPKGILQIDDAVLFPTERGIMMQRGRESECITDALDGYPFDFTQLYKPDFAKKVLAYGGIGEEQVRYVRFHEFLQGADMIYDYYDSRIILFNPSQSYAYVYSLRSKQWGTMANVFKKRVNIYPESYAVNSANQIVNVYVKEPTADVPYFLCSRPLGLGNIEVHKTMFATIARGYFRPAEKGKCGIVLYGSNDLFHWFNIKTSVSQYLRGMAGSPYKYFRIALTGSLAVDESISGASFDFQERWQNKLR